MKSTLRRIWFPKHEGDCVPTLCSVAFNGGWMLYAACTGRTWWLVFWTAMLLWHLHLDAKLRRQFKK